MKLVKHIATLAALALPAALASAQADHCADAVLVPIGIYSGSTANATPDGFAPCGLTDYTLDVWYRIATPGPGQFQVNSCGSPFNTVLALYTACGEVPIACDDDAGGVCGDDARVQIATPEVPTEYLIRVSGNSGANGNYTIRMAFSPAGSGNDECPLALPIGDETVSGTTRNTNRDGFSSCGLFGTAPDVWYLYTPSQTCTTQFDLCGSAFDTVLSVFDLCPQAGGLEIACNDDNEACGVSSTLWLPVVAGNQYLIRVSGYNAQSGDFQLAISPQCPPTGPDECADAALLFPGVYDFTNIGATGDLPSICGVGGPDVWFRYIPDFAESVTVATCGSLLDTLLSIHTDCAAPEIACDDGSCDSGSTLTFAASAGVPYFIRVTGNSGQVGQFRLELSTTPLPTCDGDVNCDGNLDGFDVQAIEQAVGGDLSNFCQSDPDFNHDGNLDGFDVSAVEAVVGGEACP